MPGGDQRKLGGAFRIDLLIALQNPWALQRTVLPGGFAVEALFDLANSRKIHGGVRFLALFEDRDCAADVLGRHFDGTAHRHVLRLRIGCSASAFVDITLQETVAGRHVGGDRSRDRRQRGGNGQNGDETWQMHQLDCDSFFAIPVRGSETDILHFFLERDSPAPFDALFQSSLIISTRSSAVPCPSL